MRFERGKTWPGAALVLPAALLLAALLPGPALAQDKSPFKVAVFVPLLKHYGPEDPYAEIFRGLIDRQRWGDRVSLRHFPAEARTNPLAVQHALEALADEPEIKALILGGTPFGSLEGCARLRARRPDILILVLDPAEDPQQMNQATSLVVSLNYAVRGYLMPTLALRSGAQVLISFPFLRRPEPYFSARQRHIMRQASEDLGLKFIEADDCPDPLTTEKNDLAAYVEKTLDHYRELYQGRTAFLAHDDEVSELLISYAVRKGGLALDSFYPSLFLGIPEALNLVKPTYDLFGQWKRLLALADEGYMRLEPPGQITTWAYPYPWTAILALAETAISALERQTDLYDLKLLASALERHSPGEQWQVNMVIDNDLDLMVPQLFVVLADSYWFGRGYQGLTRLNLPSKYNRLK